MANSIRNLNSKIKKIIFVVITIFFTLTLTEISFRIMYSIKHQNFAYILFGISNVFKFDIDYFNEYIKLSKPMQKEDELYRGFRTPPFSLRKPEGEYRIVALGESSTYGLRGGYQKSWPHLLEQKLNRGLYRNEYRVINAGIPGQTTYGVRRLLSSEILGWNPDAVIILTLYNHIDIDIVAFYKKRKTDFLFRLAKGILYDKSLLATHIMDFMGARSGVLKNKLEKYRLLLTEIIEECKDAGVELIIVKQLVKPDRFDQVYSDKCHRGEGIYYEGKYYDFLKVIDEVSAEHNVICIDFSPTSPLCKDKIDLLLYDKKVHLSDYGKELLSDVIARTIMSERTKLRK